jgi:hypothetical protein
MAARTKKNENIETAVAVAESGGIADFNLSAEIVAGKLTSNAKELGERIRGELKNFTAERYIGHPEAAKSDKAVLTKAKDAIAEKRKEITKKWNEPLDVFLSEMKALEKDVAAAYDGLNAVVKEAENAEKDDKKRQIEGYWHTLGFNVVPLERIFNPKWLNKTFSMTDVMKEVESRIEKITGELATLRSMQDEDSETLQSFYIDTLDLKATLEKGNQLKANRAALKAAEEDRKRKEEAERNAQNEAKSAENANNNADFAENPQNSAENEDKTAKIDEKQQNPLENRSSDEEIMSFKLELYGTRRQLIALRAYIDSNGIKYRKF